MNDLPKMTDERVAFVRELMSGEFSRSLPQAYREAAGAYRTEMTAYVTDTDRKLATYTLTLGADEATKVLRSALLGSIQTLAMHVALARRVEGASEEEARAFIETWTADFKADADRIVRFLWSGSTEDMPLHPDTLTTGEVASSAEAAKDRLANTFENLFMSLMHTAERFIVVFRERAFATDARKRFAALIDGWRSEAAGKLNDALGANKPSVH